MNIKAVCLAASVILAPTSVLAATVEYHAPKPSDQACADFSSFSAVVNLGIPELKLGDGVTFSLINQAVNLQIVPPGGLRIPRDGVEVKPPIRTDSVWMSLDGGSGAEIVGIELHDQRSIEALTVHANSSTGNWKPNGYFNLSMQFTGVSLDRVLIFSANNELGIVEICFPVNLE